jgi:hypothetical protein
LVGFGGATQRQESLAHAVAAGYRSIAARRPTASIDQEVDHFARRAMRVRLADGAVVQESRLSLMFLSVFFWHVIFRSSNNTLRLCLLINGTAAPDLRTECKEKATRGHKSDRHGGR